ncbi:hypothetical protein AGMMS50276_32010 [Synergistales bacterium]|nr:hypothetical protein AGMMS50276_32010 [Synergistales bacterium]
MADKQEKLNDKKEALVADEILNEAAAGRRLLTLHTRSSEEFAAAPLRSLSYPRHCSVL